MVKIKKAKTTGFCFGVKRAVDMAQGALKTNANVCSMGPIIHNPLVVKELTDKGIKAISDIDEAKNATILIRSHGIRPSIRKKITECKIPILDATCPFVEKSHRIVNDLKRDDYYIIIVGEKDHPEVVALAEAAGGKKAIVCSAKHIAKLDIKNKKVVSTGSASSRAESVAFQGKLELPRAEFIFMVTGAGNHGGIIGA